MAKKKWLDKVFDKKQAPSAVEDLSYKLKQLEDRLEEDSLDDEIKAITKGLDGDFSTSTSSATGDFSNIEEDINKSQLQKLFATEGWFYIAVTTIAKTISALPPKLEMRKKVVATINDEQTGKPEEVDRVAWVDASAEPEMELFLYPNDIQTSIEFYWLLIVDLLSTGDAFIYVDSGPGATSIARNPVNRLQQLVTANRVDVEGMYRISSAILEPILSEKGKFIEAYGLQTDAGYHQFQPEEIIHIRMPNPTHPFRGLAPIIPVLKNLLIDRYTKEHMIRFYKQGARLGGVISTQQKLTKEQLTRLERTFEKNYTGRANHHRTLVLPSGMEYKTIEQNPGETSLIEFMKNNKEPILAAYNVPPVKIGIMDGATFANALAQLKVYYEDTIIPILTLIEQSINMHPSILKVGRNLKFSFDLSSVEALQDNLEIQAKQAAAMLDGGMTPNEVRAKVWKLGPLPGGNKAKVIEDMNNPSGGFPFFGPKGTEPTTTKDPDPTDPGEKKTEESAPAAQQPQASPIVNELAPTLAPQVETPKEVLVEAAAEATTEQAIASVPFTKEQIVQRWKDMTGEAIDPFFTSRSKELEGFFKDLEKLFLRGIRKALKSRGMVSSVKSSDDDIEDDEIDSFIERQAKNPSKAMQDAMEYGFKKTLTGFDFEMDNVEAKKMLEEVSTKYITSVTETTRDQIKKVLTDGTDEGVSVGEMATRIREKFAEINEGRAKTIVRTETLTAVSMGQQLRIDQFKEEFPDDSKRLLKKWISSQDEKVRDSHDELDNEPAIPIDEAYSNGLMYPRDTDAKDASEVINCRCTQIEYLPEDADDMEDVLENNSPHANEGSKDKGGSGSGGARQGAGRPRGDGHRDEPKDEPKDSEVGGHKVSKEVQQGYESYRNAIAPVLEKVIADRNRGVTSPKLTAEEKTILKDSVKKFSEVKNKFFEENGLDKKQTALLKSMTKDWVKDSDNAKALVMRQVMAEETGGDFSKEFRYGEKITATDKAQVERVREMLEKRLGGADKLKQAIKAEMAFNQAMYASDHGEEGMTVFRGVRTTSPPKISATDSGSMKAGSSSSWSTSSAVATNFAKSEKVNQPLMFSKKIPAKDVVFYYKASPAMMSTTLGLGEGEVVVRSEKNSISGVKIDSLSGKSMTKDAVVVEDYSTDFGQNMRAEAEDVVEYDEELDPEIEEVFEEKSKGGAGSGGARTGAGRPAGSGNNPAVKLRSFVSEHMDSMPKGEKANLVAATMASAKPIVYESVDTIADAQQLLSEHSLKYDKTKIDGDTVNFMRDGKSVATLDTKKEEFTVRRSMVDKETIEGWSDEKLKREMIDLVETDPSANKEWKSRMVERHGGSPDADLSL